MELIAKALCVFLFASLVLLSTGQANGDIQLGPWVQQNAYPTTGYQYDAVNHQGYVYVAGGWNGAALDQVYSAQAFNDGSLNPWSGTTSLPEVDQGPGLTVHDGYLFASTHNGEMYSAPIVGNGVVGAWRSEPAAGFEKGGRLGTEAHNGYLYQFGGWPDADNQEVFISAIDASGHLTGWSQTTSMPQGRQHTSVHFHNDRAYLVGGITGWGSILDSVYSAPVNPDGTLGAWRQEANLPTTLWYHNSVIVDNSILLFGGRTGYNSGNVTNIYEGEIDPVTGVIGNWQTIGSMPSSQFVQATGVTYDPTYNHVYVIGGGDGSASYSNEVWAAEIVPEPASLAMIVLVSASIICRRRA